MRRTSRRSSSDDDRSTSSMLPAPHDRAPAFTVGQRHDGRVQRRPALQPGRPASRSSTRDDSRPRASPARTSRSAFARRAATRRHRRPARRRDRVLSDDGDRTAREPASGSRASRRRRAAPYVVGAADGGCSCGTSTPCSQRHVPATRAERRAVRDRRSAGRDVRRRARAMDRSAHRQGDAARHDRRHLAARARTRRPARGRHRRRCTTARIVAPVGDPIELDGDLDHAAFRRRPPARASRPRPARADRCAQARPRRHAGRARQPITSLATTAARRRLGRGRVRRSHAVARRTSRTDRPRPSSRSPAATGARRVRAGRRRRRRVRRGHASCARGAPTARRRRSRRPAADRDRRLVDPAASLAIDARTSARARRHRHRGEPMPLRCRSATPSIATTARWSRRWPPTGVLEVDRSARQGRDWTLAAPHVPDVRTSAQMSPDGRRVLATTSPACSCGPLELPQTRRRRPHVGSTR